MVPWCSDVRSPEAFARGHLRRSLNVGLDGRFAEHAGEVIDTDEDIVVVCDPGRGHEARVRLSRVGLDTVIGALDRPAEAFSERPGVAGIASRLTTRQLVAGLPCGFSYTAHCRQQELQELQELQGRLADLPAEVIWAGRRFQVETRSHTKMRVSPGAITCPAPRSP